MSRTPPPWFDAEIALPLNMSVEDTQATRVTPSNRALRTQELHLASLPGASGQMTPDVTADRVCISLPDTVKVT